MLADHVPRHGQQRPAAHLRAPDQHHGRRTRGPIPATPPNTANTTGDGLLYSVLNPLLAKYHAEYNATAPIQQPTMGAIGTILNEQNVWATAQPAGTASSANTVSASQAFGGDITVKNNGATAVTVPVTVPLGYSVVDPVTHISTPFGTQYGGTRSDWVTLAAGASIVISAAPPAITSAPTANAEVGSAFTFAVTTSGAPPVTLTETGALPAGLTYTPGAVAGTGTIAGTPLAGSGGTYPITFNATNITGPPGATQNFSLFVAEPKISVAASTNPPSFAVAGTPITSSYLVANTGNVTLVNVGVTDSMPGQSAVSCPATTLLVGASETCTALYAVTQADVDAGGINLAATASGTAPTTTVVHGTSNVTTPAIQGPAIAVTPSSNPGSFFGAGTPLALNYLVTNSGNVTLHGIGVSDRLGLAITCAGTPLAPAATESCTASYTTAAKDVTAKGVTDIPTAVGTPPSGPAVTGSFKIVVPFWSVPKITSAKLTTVPRQTHLDFSFKASGIPAPAFTLKGALPKGVTFNAATGKLSGVVNSAGSYPLTLTATSLAGTTHQSYVLRVTAPELASGVSAQPGNTKASVKWTAPVLHGGLPVTGYVVTPYLGHTALASHTFRSTVKHQVIGGLSNGRSYVFKVAVMNKLGTGPNALSTSQINALGTGPTTTASPAIKIGAPTAPGIVKASASKAIAGALVVQFYGTSGNGSPITRFTAACVSHNGGGTRAAVAGAGAQSIVVAGLTTGKTYICSVIATNKRGNGPAGMSNRVIA